MSNIDKQALREAAEKAESIGWEGIEYELDVGTRATEFICRCSPATVLALLDELEAGEKRIAELEARDINIKQHAQALFEAIANPSEHYVPAYARCLREALNGTGTAKGE